MATHGGGGVVSGVTTMIATANWSRVQLPKNWIQFFLANLANFSCCYYFSKSLHI
jgi:hypothetical protein